MAMENLRAELRKQKGGKALKGHPNHKRIADHYADIAKLHTQMGNPDGAERANKLSAYHGRLGNGGAGEAQPTTGTPWED
jgi:hypothetical protein